MISPRLQSVVLGFGCTAVIVGLLWWLSDTAHSVAIAPLPGILRDFQHAWLFDRLGSDVVPSLRRMFAGLLLGALAGMALGLALGLSRVLHAVALPVVTFLRTIPPVVLIPPAIIFLGINDLSKIAVIAFVCIWPVMLNTAAGVGELDATMRATARTFRLTAVERLRFLILPTVSPRLFAGLQTSLSFSLILMVTSELIASTNGIGFFVTQAQQSFDVSNMWAGILLIGILGFVFNVLLTAVQRRLLRWHFAMSQDGR